MVLAVYEKSVEAEAPGFVLKEVLQVDFLFC